MHEVETDRQEKENEAVIHNEKPNYTGAVDLKMRGQTMKCV